MPRKRFSVRRETLPFTSPRTNAREIVRALADCDSVLDVGCGASSPLRFLSCKRLVGVDAYVPDLDRAREQRTHDSLIVADGQDLRSLFKPNDFDACVALDVIEHFSKADGLALLETLEVIAKRKVVIVTPNGFMPQPSKVHGDFQKHLSGWEPDEMKELGYRVIGLDGLRYLRTDHHRLRFRPAPLWAVVSWLTQYALCRYYPSTAAAILCIKDLRKSGGQHTSACDAANRAAPEK
jgi:SAM-dependent methyltransferase